MIAGSGEYDRQAMDGVKMSAEDMDRQIAAVYVSTEAERAASPYVGQKRATIFIAACVIFQAIYQKLGLKELTASLKSAKDGIIEELREGKWQN